ncbi:hypothetical protein [Hyphomicrobium sp.]|uniref:hypothetical protein n=1 Tax=Hyphomicrobium sp. TaxID=82 RepID=UPI002E366641|nr:hypothetical protein [Hyphomicrobium sp.]HEX2840595.1 hypothetical protein [Hyphomicrobium sp.]
MRFGPKARMNVTTTEEKEARLKDYIRQHIQRAAGAPAGQTVYRLLALSAESPVARALQALAPELEAAGIRVESVLARRSTSTTLEIAECRFVTDHRLLDAHEQLVLDSTTVWIGDCMRRDPLKRDVYELYSDTSPVTARHAARSFAQIWRAAGPSGSLTAARKWTPRQPNLFDPSLIATGEQAPVPAVLRH